VPASAGNPGPLSSDPAGCAVLRGDMLLFRLFFFKGDPAAAPPTLPLLIFSTGGQEVGIRNQARPSDPPFPGSAHELVFVSI